MTSKDHTIKRNPEISSSFYSFFLVLRPNGIYSGQILRKLVTTNIADKAKRIIPRVPEITLVK
jgi:hypothetical protein